MSKKFYIDKNYVLGSIAFKGKTVKAVASELSVSRTYLYIALNRAYSKRESDFINKLIKLLDLNKSLVWRTEND